MGMMDGIMGRTPVPEGPGEEIPTSPWGPQDLDISKQPMPATPPVGTGTAFDASEWEEAEEEHVITPPLPPPPPPATTAPRQEGPSPPPPGIPSRQQPPKKPAVKEDEWEEVD
jgi:hypothetical protein